MISCNKCKIERTKQIGNFTHKIFDTNITINDVPYYHCEQCGDSHYISERRVESLLKEAYRHNQTTCDYTE